MLEGALKMLTQGLEGVLTMDGARRIDSIFNMWPETCGQRKCSRKNAAEKRKSMIKLLLVDDQTTYRQGLAELLSTETDLTVVAQAENGEQAIALAQTHQPDVILMDVRMPAPLQWSRSHPHHSPALPLDSHPRPLHLR